MTNSPFISKEAEEQWKDSHSTYNRKERSDKNIPRKKYNTSLPAKYKTYINRANKKQIPFTLSVQEFNTLLSAGCAYCGLSNSSTIDRIDSNEGYILSNCSPCCVKCNMMKHTMSIDVFINQVKRIYTHLNLR